MGAGRTADTADNDSALEDSDTLDHGVRLGLVVYGIVHLIVAFTALKLAWGEGGANTSQQGAFAKLASSPFGQGSLYVVALGFVALVIWQGAEAAVGHRDEDGGARLFKRVASAVKAVVYGVLGYSAAAMAAGSSGSSGKKGSESTTDNLTAELLSAPGGQVLVTLVGLGVVAVGGYLVHRGWAEKFTKRLDAQATSGERRGPIVLLGKAGYTAKGVALATVGALFVAAAVQHQPKKSGGLDVALRELLQQPYGQVLLSAVALGFACYGLFSFAWARHLDR